MILALALIAIPAAAESWFTFDQDELGSIEPGKLADLVVLDKDYLSVSNEELRKLRSLLTMVGGKVVYADEAFLE